MTKAQRKRIEEYWKILKKDVALYETARALTEGRKTRFEEAVYDTVFAPVLLCFVSWVLEEAKKRKIKRLYFLARDGYQMYLAAVSLCKMTGRKIDCRYLYGSRYAWRLPQFAREGEQCLEKICLGGIDVTFEKVMKRGNLTDKEALSVARELHVEESYHTPLSYGEVQHLKRTLKQSKLFLPYVYAHSRAAQEVTYGYLKQEGLFEEIPCALVDSGWTGSLQQTLRRLLRDAGCKKYPEGFYFGLYELPAEERQSDYHTYYFGPNGGLKQKVYFSNCLYEAVYSAPHGMTCGYKEQDRRYVPVFQREDSLNREKMEQMEEWLKCFLEAYGFQQMETGWKPPDVKGRKQMVYRLFDRLMAAPIREEAESYGVLLFSDDVTEEYAQEVAATLSEEELQNQRILNKAGILLGLKKGKLHGSAWLEGSIVKNGSRIKSRLRHAAVYKYILYIRKAFRR